MKIWMFSMSTLLLLLFEAKAQETTAVTGPVHYMQIGDTMPDIVFRNLKNYKRSTERFSAFRGKLVILDFWFGTCKSCVEAFPKLEALQKKFGDKVQIILVNFETQGKIDSTFSKWHRTSALYRNPALPSITGDTLLHKLFQVRYYPHEVWIDQKGVIKAFTSAEEVTERYIEALLSNQPVNMTLKKDNMDFDDFTRPILSQVYDGKANNLKFYSVLLPFIPGVSGGLLLNVVDTIAGTVRVSRKNMTILELIGNALNGGMGGNPYQSADFDFGKRMRLEVRDSSIYFYRPSSALSVEEWRKQNCYTYESILPIEQKDVLFQNMLIDLQRFFNLTYTQQKQKIKCLALVRTSTRDKIQSKMTKPRSFFEKDTSMYQLDMDFISTLVGRISEALKTSPWIVVDRTNYKNRIDIELRKALFHDLSLLRKVLREQYDLDLIEMEEEIPIGIIRELNYGSSLGKRFSPKTK